MFDIITLGSLPGVILLNRANPYYPGIGTRRMYKRCSGRYYERVHAVGRVCTAEAAGQLYAVEVSFRVK